MTGTVSAGELRILDLLTMSEVTLRLRLTPETVRRLAAEGVLVRVEFGRAARFTPESVAAYLQHRAAGPEPSGGGA